MWTSVHATRLWWGWGARGEAIRGEELVELTARVARLLPGHDLTDHRPPRPEDLGVPAPRVSPPESLTGVASVALADRLGHARGKAFRDVVRNLEGEVSSPPDVVFRPRHEQDVVDVLDWCARESVAAVPYGGGSSVVGGVEMRSEGPWVSVDLERLDQVLEVDPVSRAARIQAGVYGPALERQLRPHGLTLRHFPQSFAWSTLGGWLATRAGGHYATLYTHVDDRTESLRVVTTTGVSESLRVPASGAGPSPDRLFLGSEGTLGFITEAWMRVQARPRWKAAATVGFADPGAAYAATRGVAQAGLHPANCRLLDPTEAFLSAGVSTTGGLLVLAFESADHPVDAWLARAVELACDVGGTVVSRSDDSGDRADAAASWRSSFLRMPYQRDALARRSMVVETFETAVTWDRFETLHDTVMTAAEDAVKRVCGGGIVTCRFTHVYPDGPAPYYSVYAPGRWGSTVRQWDEVKAAVAEAITTAGGTITHHHGVGRDHRPWYDLQRPPLFAAALRATKNVLDPQGILNPGVLI